MSIQNINLNLDRWHKEKKAGIAAVGQNVKANAERKAKQDAIWKDRTGNARQGLQGNSFWELATVFKITLGHTVEYGPYLELANDGKYAVLERTLNSLRGELYRNIKMMLNK